ncbi:nucleic-acid-binding protein from transposon X-element [Trichonephila clavipes]|nr:nucleic-acid-binding protein from transposon X-element [Trichonephila clavipes]
MPVATPKIPPIHLKYDANYNLIMQEINRKYPKTSSKLSGEYLRIFATSIEERNEIIEFLKGKGEQFFFALHPQDVKIQKIVIKGLPISADIDDIKQDLSEQGFLVSKVAQLTKNKSKFKLPIFMVELQKSPDSPDIFKLEKCCYLTVKIDTFNRRPGPTQCYNCNLFNHSSKACHIKTRCLKCGDPHKTGECPIKDLIENPVCINCNKTGHLANSHRCEKYPKIQPKKVSPLTETNPQNSFNSDQSKVKNDISFANALKGNQQMAPLPENPAPLNEPETAPAPPKRKRNRNVIEDDDNGTFGFMDAIIELKKFFAENPSLIELGKQLRKAQSGKWQVAWKLRSSCPGNGTYLLIRINKKRAELNESDIRVN